MGFAEISRPGTTIRFEDGEAVEYKSKYCDGHGTYRSPFNGIEVVIVDQDVLWFCEECRKQYIR